MNDEVKEILGEIDNKIIPNEHWNKIKDYITNLQEENEDLKDRLKVMEHFKNSLQEENQRLKEENIKLYKKDIKIINGLKKELEITQEKWNKDKQWSECRTKEWLDYKSRCEKAIDFIKEEAGYDEEIRSCCCDLLYSDCDKLIELLGGDE